MPSSQSNNNTHGSTLCCLLRRLQAWTGGFLSGVLTGIKIRVNSLIGLHLQHRHLLAGKARRNLAPSLGSRQLIWTLLSSRVSGRSPSFCSTAFPCGRLSARLSCHPGYICVLLLRTAADTCIYFFCSAAPLVPNVGILQNHCAC